MHLQKYKSRYNYKFQSNFFYNKKVPVPVKAGADQKVPAPASTKKLGSVFATMI